MLLSPLCDQVALILGCILDLSWELKKKEREGSREKGKKRGEKKKEKKKKSKAKKKKTGLSTDDYYRTSGMRLRYLHFLSSMPTEG